MMRLPWFEHRAPKTVAEAARILAAEGPGAMLIAGGTDLLPNMKRRQMAPKLLVSLRNIPSMKGKTASAGGLTLGAGLTLTEVLADPRTPAALRQAGGPVASTRLSDIRTLRWRHIIGTRWVYHHNNHSCGQALEHSLTE